MGQEVGGRARHPILVDRDAVAAQRGRAEAQLGGQYARGIERRHLRGKGAGAPGPDRADPEPQRGQPLVGIVGAQGQPVLGARGEHAVGLGGPAGHQIVDEDADIGVGPVEHERPRTAPDAASPALSPATSPCAAASS